MHPAALEWVAAHAPAGELAIVDIGGRDVNGHPGGLFDQNCAWEVVDLHEGPRVTWVGDFLEYRPGCRYDVALCLEVAEHTAEWPEIIAHAAALLTVDTGRLIFTAAGPGRAPHSAIDGEQVRPGEHYENVDPEQLAGVLHQHFECVLVDVLGPDVRAIAWEPRR